jgi:hypothetical protein
VTEDEKHPGEAGASEPERAGKPSVERRLVVEYGTELDGVWLPLAMLRRLGEHGRWSVPFTEATTDQAQVLVAHGLAEPHNNGLCRGNGLRNFVDAFPFEPTLPFATVSSSARGDAERADNGRPTEHPEET